MITLSIRNPLSYLVAAGVKRVENRTWTTKYRGRLLIHSSGVKNAWCFEDDDFPPAFLMARDAGKKCAAMDRLTARLDKFYGVNTADEFFALMADHARLDKLKPFLRCLAIIGEVTLSDIVRDSSDPFAESSYYHWILTEPRLYDYNKVIYPIRGKLGLWDFKQEVPNG